MSLGSVKPAACPASPGTLFRSWLRSGVLRHLGFITVCWLAGGDAIRIGAWAGPPGTVIAEMALPAAGVPAAGVPAAGVPASGVPAAGRNANALQSAIAPPPTSIVEASPDPLSVCERAGVAMEQASGLPPGLLLAIGRVESGRWDSGRGRVAAWPWTINAAGKGSWFATKDEAARTVRDLLNGGTRSIDVGCFQINLLWHPTAFANLEQAFDPAANAAYAARFLLALFGQTGSWNGAVEAYHSADPTLGFAYRQQVLSSWGAAAALAAVPAGHGRASPMLSVVSRPVTLPVVIAGVQIWTPMPFGTASGVVAMPGTTTPEPARAANVATLPLPAVLYHVMPPGVRSARTIRIPARAPRVVAAEVTPSR